MTLTCGHSLTDEIKLSGMWWNRTLPAPILMSLRMSRPIVAHSLCRHILCSEDEADVLIWLCSLPPPTARLSKQKRHEMLAKNNRMEYVTHHISTFPKVSPYELWSSSFIILTRCIGVMMGLPCRACAFRKASVRIGELSVRIVMPMDMKNLKSS